MTALDITQQKIEAYTASCIERKRNATKIIGITFAPRRAFEGPCQQQAIQMYGGELAAAQSENAAFESSLNAAVINSTGKNVWILAAVFIFLLIVTIVVI